MYIVLVAALATVSGFNPTDPALAFWLNLLAVAVAIVGPPAIFPLLVDFLRKPRKQLSYDTESDAALIDQQKDLGEDMDVLLRGGALHRPTQMNDARLIMFKIINTGSGTIRREDFLYDQRHVLRFQFVAARLILCAVHHTEPDYLISVGSRKGMIHLDPLPESVPPSSPIILPPHFSPPDSVNTPKLHSYVELDGSILQRGNAIVLKFVTQGRVEMKVQGGLEGGHIVKYVPSPPVFTVPRILIGLLVALLLVLSINLSGAFRQSNCVLSFSSVEISGSTAFSDTVRREADAYHRGCPFVNLHVQSHDSAEGLLQLEQKNVDIASSEISPQEAGYNYHDLSKHEVAVIVFTMILNKQVTGIPSLTQDQITGIYDGQYTNWHQLGGPNLPIVPFGRPSGSGTQAAFTRYVLQRPGNAQVISLASTFEVISKVGSTMGAIGYADLGSANQASDTVTAININGNAPTAGLVGKGMYPFWAIERMYTRTDSNNPLVSAFITYVTDTIQTNTTFVRKGDMQPGVLSEHSSREGE